MFISFDLSYSGYFGASSADIFGVAIPITAMVIVV